jgi:hypothetical protein
VIADVSVGSLTDGGTGNVGEGVVGQRAVTWVIPGRRVGVLGTAATDTAGASDGGQADQEGPSVHTRENDTGG